VEITGGEPFLRTDVFEIFDILEKFGFRYTINTNGLILNQSRVKELHKYPSILQIAVSIDSLKKDIFAKIRGADRLDEVLAGLDRLIELGPGKAIKVNLTINRFNYMEIPEFIAFCKSKGVYLSVFPVNIGSNFRHRSLDDSLIPSDKERQGMADMFQKLSVMRKKGALVWEHSSFYKGAVDYILKGHVPPCDAGRLFFDLHADGKIAVCNDLPPFGDLTKESFETCLKRLPQQQKAIEHCYINSPCYYTCTYAISAIARNKISYSIENMKMMGSTGFLRNFLSTSKKRR